jgi:hypothetical protein
MSTLASTTKPFVAMGAKFKVVVTHAPVMGKYVVDVRFKDTDRMFGCTAFTSGSQAIQFAQAFIDIA